MRGQADRRLDEAEDEPGRVRLPVVNADPETDPNARAAARPSLEAAGRRGVGRAADLTGAAPAASGARGAREARNTPAQSRSEGSAPLAPVARSAARGRAGLGSAMPREVPEAAPRSMIIEPDRRLARGAVLLLFVVVVFLTGVFIGASFITGSTPPPPREYAVPVPLPGTAAQPDTAPAEDARGPAGPRAETATPNSAPTPVPAPGEPPAMPVAAAGPVHSAAAEAPANPPAASPPADPSGEMAVKAPAEAAPPAPAPAEPAAPPPAPEPVDASPPPPQTEVPPVAPPPARTEEAGGKPSAAERAALIARGDTLFAAQDIAAARLFYDRAADAGDALAALRMGETFDPAFLARAHLSGIVGDRAQAARWYRRARELGNGDADIMLKSLETTRK